MDKIEAFFPFPFPQKESPLQLYSAGITYKSASYRIMRDKPDAGLYVLECVIRGKGHLYYGDQYYTVTEGDVYFLQPHVPHHYHSDPDDPWEKLWFNLTGPLMDALCDAYRLRGCVYYPQCYMEKEFRKGMDILRDLKEETQDAFTLHIHHILHMLHEWKKVHPEQERSPEGLLLRDYLVRHWHEEVSLGVLAEQIRKSPAQTMRIFRKNWHCTPNQFLQKQRIFFAQQYLENSDIPVKELASMLGFRDEFYFSNWFKRYTGVSPKFYRQRFRR